MQSFWKVQTDRMVNINIVRKYFVYSGPLPFQAWYSQIFLWNVTPNYLQKFANLLTFFIEHFQNIQKWNAAGKLQYQGAMILDRLVAGFW